MDPAELRTEENLQANILCDAIQNDNKLLFDQLLAAGANHWAPYRYLKDGNVVKTTPIKVAIRHHRLSMGQQLLARDSEKQIKSDRGITLMDYAAANGSHEFIPLLLSYGAVINEKVFRIAWCTDCCSEERRNAFMEKIRRLHVLQKITNPSSSHETHKDKR